MTSIDKKNYQISGFKEFTAEVLKCMSCFEKNVMEKHYHFFDGSLLAPIMIIGQSPIYPLKVDGSFPFSLIDPENIHQYPGSIWLRNCFTSCGIDFRNIYLTNVIKDSPQGNKVTEDMIKNCSPFLEKEIKLFKGNVILLFGLPACKQFSMRPYNEKKREDGKYLIACYHPQYVIKKGQPEKSKFISALKRAKEIILNSKKEKKIDDF